MVREQRGTGLVLWIRASARRSPMPGLGRWRCWPWPPLLALPPLLTGQSISVRGERRGEERSCNREVESVMSSHHDKSHNF